MIWIGLFGVVIGAVIVLLSMFILFKFIERRQARHRELEHRVKEIETINLLNKKINEILSKRSAYIGEIGEYVSFDAFDDCYITVDDFIYLQSFAAQNSFYLPNYLLEEFFKNLSHHKVVLTPEKTAQIGGYVYKDGRMSMENFSEQLIELVKEQKDNLNRVVKEPLRYFEVQ